MARVLVTGGSGLIGRSLVERLRERGDAVTVLTRGTSGKRNGVQFEHWDPAHDASPLLTEAYDAIVNLAGESAVGVRYTDATKRGIRDSRVKSTEWLVRAQERATHKPSVFVNGSAVGYYGSNQAHTPVDESGKAGDDFLAEVCVEWEAAAKPAEALGVRVVLARTGIVLSEQGGALKAMVTPFKFFVGGPIGSGEQGVSWIHMDDEVAALLYCIDKPALSGPVNICGPAPVSNAEVSRLIGQILHRPAALKAPAFALKALFGQGAQPLLGGQWALPRALEKAGFEFGFRDIRAALEACIR